MSPLKKLLLRLLIYGSVAAYIAGDLFVFQGPLRRKLCLLYTSDAADERG